MMSRAVLLAAAALIAGCAGGATIATTAGGPADHIPIAVQKPDGPGPFPAVVIAHDCSGLGPRSSGAPARWARELLGRGYAVLMPDSFGTRGFPDGVCTDASPSRVNVSPAARARDAYGALAHARTLPDVDGRRVGLMGGSHGGSTTLASMLAPESDRDPLAPDKRAGFAAAVALYPSCDRDARVWQNDSGVYRPIAPLLILIGEKDDWTPAEPAIPWQSRSIRAPTTRSTARIPCGTSPRASTATRPVAAAPRPAVTPRRGPTPSARSPRSSTAI
jgi:dienelactone hydrolase